MHIQEQHTRLALAMHVPGHWPEAGSRYEKNNQQTKNDFLHKIKFKV
jgi:hypothetical protein